VRNLYNILFFIGFLLASPYYFFRLQRRGNWRNGFSQRFAKYPAELKQFITNSHVLWIHAVSVGEVGLCTQLIHALEPLLPNMKIVVSTTTTTGMAELRRRLPTHVSKIYYPIDRRKYVNRALALINPEAIILVEAEIWPNFIWRVKRLGIPLFLANARISDRSFPRYKKFGFLFRDLFATFTGVGCQNEVDAQRLREVGCRPEVIQVVGNLKFDAAKLSERRTLDVAGLFRQLGLTADSLVLVAGSTHAGEEIILENIVRRLRVRFPKLFLVLVPRHAERCRELARQLRTQGLKFILRNEITPDTQYQPGDLEGLLVNTTGELKFFYEQATMVFVGKSLTAVGGQSPIEPGSLGKPMVFGPNMQNFADVTRSFVQQKGALQVINAESLEAAIEKLLQDGTLRAEMGRNAFKVVRENQGAIDRTVEMILAQLKPRGIYIAPQKKIS
jgi:3-deoxy-D-manno-octulosonic-acid transferase